MATDQPAHVDYPTLRSVALEYLRSHRDGNVVFWGDHEIRRMCERRGLKYWDQDDCLVEELFHEFYLERLIVWGPRPPKSGGFPGYRTTQYGDQVLDADE